MIKFPLILLSELDYRAVNELVHGLTPIKTEATCEMYLYDDWFPSVILEVPCHGRVAARVVFTVLSAAPRLQLQRQDGDKCAPVVALIKRQCPIHSPEHSSQVRVGNSKTRKRIRGTCD